MCIKEVRARALFDIGPSHSFMCESFATTHSFELLELVDPMDILTADTYTYMQNFIHECPIVIGDYTLPIDMLLYRL